MRITTAAEAAARDADAIASGIASWTLMQNAGAAAAKFILKNVMGSVEFRGSTKGARQPVVLVYAGNGNNGGDAYVVAAHLVQAGVDVRMVAIAEPRTADAQRARALFESATPARSGHRATHKIHLGDLDLDENKNADLDEIEKADLDEIELDGRKFAPPLARVDQAAGNASDVVVVDGLLGTGQQGPLRENQRAAANTINALAARGATVVALDIPTGVNATTGELVEGAVRARHTLSFGTMKRAHLIQREQCGAVTVLDIGLGEFANRNDAAWMFADEALIASMVPHVEWTSYKTRRGQLAIVGGAHGMAGAVVLASQAALRSGTGLVHSYVHEASVMALQISEPQVISHTWSDAPRGATALAVGPGLGRSPESETVLRGLLVHGPLRVPMVLDADALTLIGADINRLKALALSCPVICTPHIGEFARLIGGAVATSLSDRVAQCAEFAKRAGVTVLLKGTPTIIAAPDAELPIIVARGTPVLGTGGSGDMLTGIVGALLAQGASNRAAAAVAAWVHGRAAEIATGKAGTVRGVTLREVLRAMPRAWKALNISTASTSADPSVLAALPRVWSER